MQAHPVVEASAGRPRVQPRRQRWRLQVALLAAVVVLPVVLVGIQLARPVPAAVLHISVPASLSVPGRASGIRWSAQGHARIDVEGLAIADSR